MSNEGMIITPGINNEDDEGASQEPSVGMKADLPEGVAIAWMPDPRERYAYRMAMVGGSVASQESRLNQLGTEGWELIGLSGDTAIMKRRMVGVPVHVDEDGNPIGLASNDG